MDGYTAAEEAYKKGYDKGYEAGKRDGVEHGRWRAINRDCRGYASSFECSVCECISNQTHYEKHCMFDFCPVCGSIMDLRDEEMYKIEIWKHKKIEEVYEAEDIQNILAWYKWYWHNAYENGDCAFSVYKDGIEYPTEKLWELGFYK